MRGISMILKKKAEVFDFAEQYRQFISKCKTERECVKEGVRLLKEAGYADLKELLLITGH